jgi:hypothetical protein
VGARSPKIRFRAVFADVVRLIGYALHSQGPPSKDQIASAALTRVENEITNMLRRLRTQAEVARHRYLDEDFCCQPSSLTALENEMRREVDLEKTIASLPTAYRVHAGDARTITSYLGAA